MTYFLIISCVVSGWAMLSLLGTERTQMVKDLESQLRREEAQKPTPPAPPNAPAPEPAPTPKPKH
jgi:hypothetical protein